MKTLTTVLALLSALGTTALAGAAPAEAAEAADGGYRYWSFWEQSDKGSWQYATRGPSVQRPADGDVLGFRFALTTGSEDAAQPRPKAGFDEVCADTEKQPDHKRVALSIDFGTGKDAPEGGTPPKPRTACADVGENATAAEALAAVVEPLRYDSGSMLCAVGGYPESGCGEQVSGKEKTGEASGTGDAGDAAAEEESGLPTGLGIGAGVAVIAALAVAGVLQARRRR